MLKLFQKTVSLFLCAPTLDARSGMIWVRRYRKDTLPRISCAPGPRVYIANQIRIRPKRIRHPQARTDEDLLAIPKKPYQLVMNLVIKRCTAVR